MVVGKISSASFLLFVLWGSGEWSLKEAIRPSFRELCDAHASIWIVQPMHLKHVLVGTWDSRASCLIVVGKSI